MDISYNGVVHDGTGQLFDGILMFKLIESMQY